MIFFRFRHLSPRPGQGSPAERTLRMVLLAAVFLLVAWGFWANMERRMEGLGARGQVQDAADALAPGERKELEAIVKRFQKRFDLVLEVRVLAAPFRPESWPGKSVLLAVNPASQQVVFTAPPLVRRAMGDAFMAELADSFAPCFAAPENTQTAWKAGLFSALAQIERKLAELTR
jgi:hypothetical protein